MATGTHEPHAVASAHSRKILQGEHDRVTVAKADNFCVNGLPRVPIDLDHRADWHGKVGHGSRHAGHLHNAAG
jgi:hypothetical protein